MGRLITIAVALVTIAVVAMLALPAMLSARLTGLDISQRLSAALGEPVAVRGDTVATVFPSPGVAVRDVVISEIDGDAERSLVSIPSLGASLKLGPLLLGSVEFRTVTLVEPHIRLTGNGHAGGGRSPAGIFMLSARPGGLHLDEIVIRDGTIVTGSQASGDMETMTDVDARIVLHNGSRIGNVAASFAWRGHVIDIEAAVDDALAAASESGSRGRLTVEAVPDRPSADAGAANIAERDVDDESGYTDPPAQSGGQASVSDAADSVIGPIRIAGQVRTEDALVTIADATVELDGNVGEGMLVAGPGGNGPRLEASLAFRRLRLPPLVHSASASTIARSLGIPIPSTWPARAEIDATIAVDEVLLGDGRLSDVSVTYRARGDRMVVSLDRAGLAGGRIAATLNGELAGGDVAARLSACLDDVPLADVRTLVGPTRAHRLLGMGEPVRGTGTAALELAARGAGAQSIIESMSGWMMADIRDGAIGGIDLELTLERLTDDNAGIAEGNVPFVPVLGHTPFSWMWARVAIERGVARATAIGLTGDRYAVSLSGESDLKRWEVDAEGVATLFDAGQETRHDHADLLVELPFGVGGTLARPMIVPGIPRHEAGPNADTGDESGYPVVASDATAGQFRWEAYRAVRRACQAGAGP
jgi:AsmA protein